MSTQDIVQKLWNLCNVLRDDGITYHQYVTELTYILFLKMLEETGEEAALRKEIEQAYKKRLEQYAKSRGKRVDELTEEERNGRKTLRGVISKYFNNSFLGAVSSLVKEEDISVEELKELIRQVEEGQNEKPQ